MIKILKHLLFTLILGAFWTPIMGQGKAIGKVFTGNSEEGSTIMIKWISPEIIHPEGCLIYRKTKNATAWQLLTENPIVKTELRPSGDEYEEANNFLEDFLENQGLKDAEGVVKLLIGKQMVFSPEFAHYLGVYYEDTNVELGSTYEYKVIHIKRNREILIGISPPITASPFKPIAPPKEFGLVPEEEVDTALNLTWLPEEGRYFGVEVYRSEEGETIEKVSNNPVFPSRVKGKNGGFSYPDFFYTNSNHIVGRKYQYQVRGIDFFGREGLPSENLEWFAQDKSPAKPPFNIEASRFNQNQILLTWSDTSTLNNVSGYHVMVSRRVDDEYIRDNSKLLSLNTKEYLFKISELGDYFFYVEAVNLQGQATPSPITGTTAHDIDPPSATENLIAEPHVGYINLRWDANKEPDIVGYFIFRSIRNDGSPFMLLNQEPVIVTSYTNQLPKSSKNTYYYKVAAVDSSGNQGQRSEIAQTAMPDVIAPVAPTIIKINMDSIDATITWLPSIDDDLKGYTIYKCINEDTLNWTAVNQIPLVENTRNYTDKNLPPNTKVSYKLIAEDNTGNRSVFSNTYTSMTPVVSSQNTTINKLKVNYDKRKNQMVIKWKPIDLKEVRSITLFRKSSKGHFLPISSELKTEKGFIDKTLNPGQTYSYQVRTYFNNGTIEKSEVLKVEVEAE
jgi:hypothetical protein